MSEHTDKPRRGESLEDYTLRMMPLFKKVFQRNSERELRKTIKKQYERDIYHVSLGHKRVTVPISKPTANKTLAEKEQLLGLRKRHTLNLTKKKEKK